MKTKAFIAAVALGVVAGQTVTFVGGLANTTGWDVVKSGTQATAIGTMQGTTVMATDVNLYPRGKMTPTPKKPK